MDKENVFYLAVKKTKVIKFVGEWMELENIILCEVNNPRYFSAMGIMASVN